MSSLFAAQLGLQWQRLEGCAALNPTLWIDHLLDWSAIEAWRAFPGEGQTEMALSFQAWWLTGSKLWAACYFTL